MATVQETAARLGTSLPVFTERSDPGLHGAWADRVLLVDPMRSPGRDAIDGEAMSHAGCPVPRPYGPVPVRTDARVRAVHDPLRAMVDALDDEPAPPFSP